jgi:hypothetical protein
MTWRTAAAAPPDPLTAINDPQASFFRNWRRDAREASSSIFSLGDGGLVMFFI